MDPMWNNAFQHAYFLTPNLVLIATLTDSLVVHVGKTHVFVIMTMNNEKHRGPLIVALVCKKSSMVVSL